jgi:FxsC-like protein
MWRHGIRSRSLLGNLPADLRSDLALGLRGRCSRWVEERNDTENGTTMSERWFFLSYARKPADPYVERVYEDLVSQVSLLSGSPTQEIAFRDINDIDVGEEWPDKLAAALQGCRVFVPVYTPAYFQSEYCGKELAIFQSRLDAYQQQKPGAARPPLILPLLWVSRADLPAELPESVTNMQFAKGELAELYVAKGLRHLRNKSRFRDQWKELLETFARRIVQVAKAHPLDPLLNMAPLKEVESAWRKSRAQAAQAVSPAPQGGTSEPPHTGPRFVQFVFLAACRDELQPLRTKLDYYGRDGRDWKPYLPEVVDEIEYVAQGIAQGEKLRYEVVPVDDQLLPHIRAAEAENKIVVIMVDTWTLQLKQYEKFISGYDDQFFLNCAVLVPWNSSDAETMQSRAKLEEVLRRIFPKKQVFDPDFFLSAISSPDDLTQKLKVALNAAKMRIIKFSEAKKKTEGERSIARPLISASS